MHESRPHKHRLVSSSIKYNLCRRARNIIPEERPIRTVGLLLDRHREFLQSVRHLVKMGVSEHASQFASESTFVAFSCKERDRLSATTTSAYEISVGMRRP